jgi:hypothetical protein
MSGFFTCGGLLRRHNTQNTEGNNMFKDLSDYQCLIESQGFIITKSTLNTWQIRTEDGYFVCTDKFSSAEAAYSYLAGTLAIEVLRAISMGFTVAQVDEADTYRFCDPHGNYSDVEYESECGAWAQVIVEIDSYLEADEVNRATDLLAQL